MDPPNVPPQGGSAWRSQSRWFYSPSWTKNHDRIFITAMYSQARRGHKQVTRTPNMHSLTYAVDAVNNRFGLTLNYKGAKKRLERLRLRYNTFRRLITDPGFSWLPEDNYILAAEPHWTRIVAEIPFANAYRLEDEPYYYELHAIFGTDPVQQPPALPLDISSEEEDSVGSNVTE